MPGIFGKIGKIGAIFGKKKLADMTSEELENELQKEAAKQKKICK